MSTKSEPETLGGSAPAHDERLGGGPLRILVIGRTDGASALGRLLDPSRLGDRTWIHLDDPDAALHRLTEEGGDALVLEAGPEPSSTRELLARARARDPGLPVLLVLHGDDANLRNEARELGAMEVVRVRDADPAEVERALRALLETRRRERVEARVRAILERCREMVAVMDARGSVRWTGKAFPRSVGYEPEDLLDGGLLDRIHPDDRAAFGEAVEAVGGDPGSSRDLEFRLRDAEGAWRHLEARVRNELHEPLVEGLVLNATDVTELRAARADLESRAAELRERMRELHCLYDVEEILGSASLGEQGGVELEPLQAVVERLPAGFQKAHDVGVALRVRGRVLRSGTLDPEAPHLAVPVREGAREVGTLEAAPGPGRWTPGEDPFLPQEHVLLRSVADRIGETLGHWRAQTALERSEAYFRALAERSGLMLAVVGEDARVRYATGEVERLLGVSAPELEGRTILDFVAPEDVDEALDVLGAAIREPGTAPTSRARVRGPEGGFVWVDYTARSLAEDPAVQGVVVVGRDVTEQVERERRLRFQAELLDQVAQLVFAVDPDGRVIYWNRAAERILGWSWEEIGGRALMDLIVPRELTEVALEVRGLAERGESWSGEIQLLRKDGTRATIRGTIAPGEGPLEAGGVRIGSGVDVTELRRAERALAEHRELLSHIVGRAPLLIFALDTEGRFTLSEGRKLEVLGLRPGQVVGQSVFELYAHRPDIRDDVRRALSGERLHTLRESEGHVFETWWAPLPDPGGAVAVSVDVTERSRAEEEQQRLLALVEASQDFVAIATADGRILHLNEAGRRLVGLEPGLELDEAEVRIDDLHPGWAMEVLREEAVPTAVATGTWRGELELRGPEGGIPVSQTVVAHRSSDGEVEFLSTVAHDLRQVHRASQRARFQAHLLDAVGQAVIATDADGTVTYWNRAAEELYGWTAEEAVGRPIVELTPTQVTRDQALEVLDRLRAGHAWTGELQVRRKDGTSFPAFVHNTPLVGPDGEVAGVVGISSDLTERKELESELRQAQKMEAIGRLAGGVAHDFNNLLTAIHGHADLLLDDLPRDSELRDEAIQIQRAGERAAELTRQLLAFSRKQMLQARLLDLRRVVEEMQPMLRRLLPASVALRVETEGRMALVQADASQIQQVLLNLAVNAGDAMEGEGTLTLAVDHTELSPEGAEALPWAAEAGPYVRLTVADTGVGMDPEVQAHIFEPFFTTKPEGKGTGLGLSTVFGIVKQSGGHVFVESEPGVGTTFRVLLPRAAGKLDGEEGAAADKRTGAADAAQGTILVVEDDASVRRLTQRILERAGYRVLLARNGREALEAAGSAEDEIHLVLSDVVMPEMGGARLAELLREHHPGLRVVLTSGYSEEELVDDIRSRGVAFLGKPFTPDRLRAVIQEALEGPPSG